jgi:hypothetical protein
MRRAWFGWLGLGLVLAGMVHAQTAPEAAEAASLPAPAPVSAPAGPALPPATPEKLPRWRGFNLLNKYLAAKRRPFQEDDFRIIHQLGFNFARLPMDYRAWTLPDGRIDEQQLAEIDQAVAWGGKYGVHVCLNLHSAPGYTVGKPELRSLWYDADARRRCAAQWAMFARRYKGIPNERLSFNPINEPAEIDGRTYASVMGEIVAAVRQEDPDRLIIADGLDYGTRPSPELAPLRVAMATRGYQPMELTHYRASWIAGAKDLPVPVWPDYRLSPRLYGPGGGLQHATPITLEGPFPVGTRLVVGIGTVADRGRLVVRADDLVVFDQPFVSGARSLRGETVRFNLEANYYQNTFHLTQEIVLTRAASRITLSDEDGVWLGLELLTVQPAGRGRVYNLAFDLAMESTEHGRRAVFDPAHPSQPWTTDMTVGRGWLQETLVRPWRETELAGTGVMVGEWGVHNQTPHDVALHWMEDNLATFKEAGWGWALWNLYGSFGILDSNRLDVHYEDYEGHALDRQMLELLQRY